MKSGNCEELETERMKYSAETVKDLDFLAGEDEVVHYEKKDKKQSVRYGQELSCSRKIWDMLSPIVYFLLCMDGVTLAVLIVASLITGVRGLTIIQLMELIPWLPCLSLFLANGITIFNQRKNYFLDQMRFGPYDQTWTMSNIILSCCLAVCIGHLWSIFINLSELEHVFPGYAESAASSFKGQNPFLLITATVLLGPVAEEMIFRGMTYQRVKNYLNSSWAVGISSLLFGICHGNMIQFFYAVVLGVILAVLYEYSQSLLVPVLAHMATNLWAIYSENCVILLTKIITQGKILLLTIEGVVAVVCMIVLFGNKRKVVSHQQGKLR